MHGLPRAALCAALIAAAASSLADELPPTAGSAAARDDVLIVANANVIGSEEVALHYAAARGIAEDRILSVRSPATYTIDWNQFEVLRDQIIDFLLRETLADDVPPPACLNGEPFYCEQKLALIRNSTTIRYVVLVRGVPTRFYPAARNFRLSTLPTTVDSYLRYHLLNDFPEENARDPLQFREATNREWDFADGSGMRPIDPARDHEFAIGRISSIRTHTGLRTPPSTRSSPPTGSTSRPGCPSMAQGRPSTAGRPGATNSGSGEPGPNVPSISATGRTRAPV
jgi:hypothetical protein